MHMEKFNEELTVQEGKRLIQILAEKLDVIKTLNEKIVNHPDIEDIVEELVQSEENTINIELQLTKMSSRIQERERDEQSTNVNQNHYQRGEESTHMITENSSQVSAHIQSNCHKLPKLTMPLFNGDVTQWQTFWDNYESSIHNNTSLSDVQKFSYLRSLLTDSAASCISGLPLTNTNYSKAVNLLVDRFGQSHKIINSYMQSLLGLQKPRNDYESLQTFNDQLLTYVRGLESLGQHPESYGDLLVPVITEKLPVETRKNIIRENGNGQIKLDHLIAAIQKEVGVLEAGEKEACPSLHATAALFLTNADIKGNYKDYEDERKAAISTVENTIPLCPFCEKNHRASDCTNVASIEEKLELVKGKRLCYNCLSKKHQVSSCHSHFRCKTCGRKHHTSICDQRPTSSLDPSAREFQPKGPVTTNFHSSATQLEVLETGQNVCQYSHPPTAMFHINTERNIQTDYRQNKSKKNKERVNKVLSCHNCEERHRANDFTVIKTRSEKMKLIKRKRLCYNCLSSKHKVSACPSKARCRNCGRKHHTSICDNRSGTKVLSYSRDFTPKTTVTSHSHSPETGRQNVLQRTAVAQTGYSESNSETIIPKQSEKTKSESVNNTLVFSTNRGGRSDDIQNFEAEMQQTTSRQRWPDPCCSYTYQNCSC